MQENTADSNENRYEKYSEHKISLDYAPSNTMQQRYVIWDTTATSAAKVENYRVYGVVASSSASLYGIYKVNFQDFEGSTAPTMDYYDIGSSSGVILEHITFSKTKIFVGGYKTYGTNKCPVIGRITLDMTMEYMVSHDCSSG